MKLVRLVSIWILVAVGCGKSPPPQHIQAWVESWGKMGMYLPNDEQITFLRLNYHDVQPELAAALTHEKPEVRQCAAYVIGKIGVDANSLGPDLSRQLTAEKERIVRIYLESALAGVRFQNKEAVDILRAQFESLKSDNTAPQLFGGYADVDEKINVAAALYNLSGGADREKHLQFVMQWLKPPSAESNPIEREGYWERRWMAVIALESMTDATAAIPLLEAILQEQGAKEWVSVHVPRVLGVLKRPGA